jgi:hypothetical protein
MGALDEYGAARWAREGFRVKVATLKLANGNLGDLQRHVEAAKRDYRDVLVAAEYPEYWRGTSSVANPATIDREEAIDRDWEQYQSWLNRP